MSLNLTNYMKPAISKKNHLYNIQNNILFQCFDCFGIETDVLQEKVLKNSIPKKKKSFFSIPFN